MYVVLENISFKYNLDEPARLTNVNINIKPGHVIGLLGECGAGKSTLLSLIAGLIKPTAGKIIYNNSEKKNIKNKDISGNIGFMLQEPEAQFFLPTIREELAFGYINRGEHWEDGQLKELLDDVGLSHITLDRKPFSLSGGEQRRLSLGILLAQKPWLLLLDEPNAGMDSPGLSKIIKILQNLKKKGISLVISSHDSDFLDRIADEYIILQQGRIELQASRAELSSKVKLLSKWCVKPPAILSLINLLTKEQEVSIDNIRTPEQLLAVLRGKY